MPTNTLHTDSGSYSAGKMFVRCKVSHFSTVTSETFEGVSANKQDGARLDVVVDGFWGSTFERTYLDVSSRVFNPLAPSNQKRSMSATYRSHEKEKKTKSP